MTRFVFRRAGEPRPRQFRHAGLIVPPGMLAISKESRPERLANRRAREAAAAALSRDFADVLASFRAGITVGQAEAAVAAGDARVIVNAAMPNELEAQLVAVVNQSLENALEAGAGIGLRFAPVALEGVPVGLATEAAVAFVERQGASAVLGVTDSVQAGIREILVLGLEDRLAPVEVARRIGDLAGLTPRQVRAVERFRAATTARLAPIPEALTPDVERVIGQEVARFRDRQLLLRGRTIAETETQAAITRGEQAFWDQAVAEHAVNPEDIFKTWRTVLDARVCHICEPLHGQVVPYQEVFLTAAGGRTGPPAHPRCRCFLEYAEQGEPSTRPDRGAGAIGDQANLRLLDPTALQDDRMHAESALLRSRNRLHLLPPRTAAARRLRQQIAIQESTVRSINLRLNALDRTGYTLDALGLQRIAIGSNVRNVRGRNLARDEVVQVVAYERRYGGRRGYDRLRVRRADGSVTTVAHSSVLLEQTPRRRGG